MKPSEILKEAAAIRAELEAMVLADMPSPADCLVTSTWRLIPEYANFQVKLLGKMCINGAEHDVSYIMPMDATQADLSRVFEQFCKDFIYKSGIRDALAKAVIDARIFPLKKS